jgi:hypothetical protein
MIFFDAALFGFPRRNGVHRNFFIALSEDCEAIAVETLTKAASLRCDCAPAG